MKRKLIVVLALIAVSFSFCGKNGGLIADGDLKVLNAAPGFGPVNITIDDTKFNTNPLAYLSATGYKSLAAGGHPLKVGYPTADTSVFAGTLNVIGEVPQTFFIVGTASSLNAFVLVDNFNTNIPGKALIRFLNLSPGSPVIDFGTLKNGTFSAIYTARAFETPTTAIQNSAFNSIDTGSYVFDTRINGTGVSFFTSDPVTLQQGKAYTIYTRGIQGNATYPVGIELMSHN